MPGMAVFFTENLATELGISNGSSETLVSIVYEETAGRRYAISAEVDFKAYKNSDPDAQYPHRVVLKPITATIHFRLPSSEKTYSATRSQLPLIPAFAFTSHKRPGPLTRCVLHRFGELSDNPECICHAVACPIAKRALHSSPF